MLLFSILNDWLIITHAVIYQVITQYISISHTVTAGHGFSESVCRSMVAMLDRDQSGKLGFEEFKTLLDEIAKWKAVFKLYDRDNSLSLSASELRDALNSAGYRLNNKVLNALVHRYAGADGTIAFDDFIMCAIKIRTMIGKSWKFLFAQK